MLPTKFRLIWQSGFREDFKKSANQKQELPMGSNSSTNMATTGNSHFLLVDF
jgi:hypothetical protein